MGKSLKTIENIIYHLSEDGDSLYLEIGLPYDRYQSLMQECVDSYGAMNIDCGEMIKQTASYFEYKYMGIKIKIKLLL